MDGFFFFSVFLLYYYYYTICIMISCFCIYYCLNFSDIYMLQGRVWVLWGWRCCFLTYSITYTQQLNYENRSNQVVWNKECENIYCSFFYSFKKQLYLNLLAFSCLLLTLKGSYFLIHITFVFVLWHTITLVLWHNQVLTNLYLSTIYLNVFYIFCFQF